MKILQIIFNIIFNPLNNISIGKGNNKLSEFFIKKPIFIFLAAIVVTAIIFYLAYFIA